MTNPRVLITGASGLIGSSLIRNRPEPSDIRLRLARHQTPLPAHCDPYEQVTGDFCQLQDCLQACAGVDWVLHAAGKVGSAGSSPQQAMSSMLDHLVLTCRLMEAAWIQGVKKFLLLSSTTGYPEQSGPIGEDAMFQGTPPDCYFGYGWAKRYAELLGQYTERNSGMEVIVLRPSAVYGPGDFSHHVIPSLFKKVQSKQDPFEIWGHGDQERDFLFVDDLARACWLALNNLPGGRPINVASCETVTVSRLAELILKVSGHEPSKVVYLSDKPQAIARRQFCTDRARDELGFEAQVSLESGLRQTWDWLCQFSP